MAWSSSDRAERLPKDWQARKRIVRDRAGGRCEAVQRGRRCPYPGSECDHVIAGDDHRLSNLAWLCHDHHQVKTTAEARAAFAAMWALARPPVEAHPGLVPSGKAPRRPGLVSTRGRS